MSKEVKRYGMCGFESGIVEMEDGPYVDSDDYDALRSLSDDQAAAVTALNKHTEALTAERDALLAERDRLREALEHCIDSLGSEYALPSECIKQARAALQGAQP